MTGEAGTDAPSSFEISVVVGNPKPASKTLAIAQALAERVAEAAAVEDRTNYSTVDLSELAGSIFDWSSPEVSAAVRTVERSRIAIIASPTYKASYTGLLKSFLDWFGETDLRGVLAIPLMVGATPRHALAVELHLRPTLLEIGAVMPTRGLFVLEGEIGDLDAVIDAWLERARGPLAAMLEGDLRKGDNL